MTSAAATQRSQLESVLQLVDQTRTQLPTLLRTFAIPSTSSELASIWTERSNAAAESLRRLKTGLESIDGIVVQARESERRDGTGIIVTPRERQDNVLGGLNAVLGDRKQAKTHELNQVEVRTRAELEETLQKWNLTHARVTCTLIREEEVAFELKGIMKCTLMLNRGNDELRSIQVERVACFGLKEQVRLWYSSRSSIGAN